MSETTSQATEVSQASPSPDSTPTTTTGKVFNRVLSSAWMRLLLWFVLAGVQLSALPEKPQTVAKHFDAHYHYMNDEVARRTIVEYGQLPLWNPYFCGGLPMLGNPQTVVASPDFLLRLAYGTGPGRRLAILLFFLLGLEGMFRLARYYGLSPPAALFAAAVFAMSGRFTQVMNFGWTNMLTFHLLPALLLCYEHGLTKWRWRLAGGALLAWIVLAGGNYSIAFAGVLVGYATVAALGRKAFRMAGSENMRWRAPITTAAGIGIVGLGAAMVRLLPVMDTLGSIPERVISKGHMTNAYVVFKYLTHGVKKQEIPHDISYISLLLIGLAILGILVNAKRSRAFFAGAMFFFVLAMGNFGAWSPYGLLSELPIYSQLRFPARYTILVSLFLALGSATAVMWLQQAPVAAYAARLQSWIAARGRRLARAGLETAGFIGVLLVVGLVVKVVPDLGRNNGVHPKRIYNDEAPVEARTGDGALPWFRQGIGNRWDVHVFAPLEVGSLQCVEGAEFPQSPALRPDLPAEEYPLNPKVATVKRLDWTPNAITLKVVAKAPTKVIVNQNYNERWTTDVGEVVSHKKLLAVSVPKGEHTIELQYTQPGLLAGFLTSLVFWLWMLFELLRAAWTSGRALWGRWKALPNVPEQEPGPEPPPKPSGNKDDAEPVAAAEPEPPDAPEPEPVAWTAEPAPVVLAAAEPAPPWVEPMAVEPEPVSREPLEPPPEQGSLTSEPEPVSPASEPVAPAADPVPAEPAPLVPALLPTPEAPTTGDDEGPEKV